MENGSHSFDLQFVWGEMSHSLGFTSFWENLARAHLKLISGYGPGCQPALLSLMRHKCAHSETSINSFLTI